MNINHSGIQENIKNNNGKKALDASITVRIDGNTKKEFEEVCDKMGMTVSYAINAFIDKVINIKALPFSLDGYKRKRKLFVAEGKYNISDDILFSDDISELFENEDNNESII